MGWIELDTLEKKFNDKKKIIFSELDRIII